MAHRAKLPLQIRPRAWVPGSLRERSPGRRLRKVHVTTVPCQRQEGAQGKRRQCREGTRLGKSYPTYQARHLDSISHQCPKVATNQSWNEDGPWDDDKASEENRQIPFPTWRAHDPDQLHRLTRYRKPAIRPMCLLYQHVTRHCLHQPLLHPRPTLSLLLRPRQQHQQLVPHYNQPLRLH
jgi:hypothetical protein